MSDSEEDDWDQTRKDLRKKSAQLVLQKAPLGKLFAPSPRARASVGTDDTPGYNGNCSFPPRTINRQLSSGSSTATAPQPQLHSRSISAPQSLIPQLNRYTTAPGNTPPRHNEDAVDALLQTMSPTGGTGETSQLSSPEKESLGCDRASPTTESGKKHRVVNMTAAEYSAMMLERQQSSSSGAPLEVNRTQSTTSLSGDGGAAPEFKGQELSGTGGAPEAPDSRPGSRIGTRKMRPSSIDLDAADVQTEGATGSSCSAPPTRSTPGSRRSRRTPGSGVRMLPGEEALARWSVDNEWHPVTIVGSVNSEGMVRVRWDDVSFTEEVRAADIRARPHEQILPDTPRSREALLQYLHELMLGILERNEILATLVAASGPKAVCQLCGTSVQLWKKLSEVYAVMRGGTPVVQISGGFATVAEAVQAGDLESAFSLLWSGADPNETSNNAGKSALLIAAQRNWTGSVALLLRFKASTNAREGRSGRTALMLAARHGANGALQRLLLHGADSGTTDTDGWRALHYATHAEDLVAVRILLNNGALDRPDQAGIKAENIATQKGNAMITELFRMASSSVGTLRA